jgi:hypothetical protein
VIVNEAVDDELWPKVHVPAQHLQRLNRPEAAKGEVLDRDAKSVRQDLGIGLLVLEQVTPGKGAPERHDGDVLAAWRARRADAATAIVRENVE